MSGKTLRCLWLGAEASGSIFHGKGQVTSFAVFQENNSGMMLFSNADGLDAPDKRSGSGGE